MLTALVLYHLGFLSLCISHSTLADAMKFGILASLVSLVSCAFATPNPLPGGCTSLRDLYRGSPLDSFPLHSVRRGSRSGNHVQPQQQGTSGVADTDRRNSCNRLRVQKYFVFSTDEGIKIFTSPSLTG